MKRLRAALKKAREKLWQLIRKRHDAKPGGDRRKKLSKKVQQARQRKDDLLEKIKDAHQPSGPTTVIDGKPVATWIAKDVLKARERGLWHGYVVSGYRSPEYSESLCFAMCGHPTCPGTCAGRGSAHSQLAYPAGAVDVDLAHRDEFARAMQTIGSVLKNALPYDPNHFSASGH
jgi:hypothetical protein